MAALSSQVLAVSEEAQRPRALERQPGVNERSGTAVMVYKERLDGCAHRYTYKLSSVNHF